MPQLRRRSSKLDKVLSGSYLRVADTHNLLAAGQAVRMRHGVGWRISAIGNCSNSFRYLRFRPVIDISGEILRVIIDVVERPEPRREIGNSHGESSKDGLKS